MKKSKIVAPALAMIAFATAASITGTVAWFTANNSVNVSGMTFQTKVSDNIMIAAQKTESQFTSEDLTQTRFARLEPTSTVNGANFFWVSKAKADGSANENYKAYTEEKVEEDSVVKNAAPDAGTSGKAYYDQAFNGAFVSGTPGSSTVVYGYLDYAFYLKVNYTTTAATYLIMNKCELKYNNGALEGSDKAWRVAVMAADGGSDAADTQASTYAPAAGDKKAILSVDGADNQVSGQAASQTGAPASSRAAVSYNTWGENHIDKSEAVQTKYYKVVVRLWLEGEDKSCTVDNYKLLTAQYSLNVGFGLVASVSTGYADKINSVKA